MMLYLLAGSMILGLIPWIQAFRANRGTSLASAILWAMAAWMAWTAAYVLESADGPALKPWRYVALCLVGCAGIAVLGARRPHVGAWNFVVLGLLAVMALPIVEKQLLGTESMDGVRAYFLCGTLAVGILNYLPTRVWLAVLGVVIWCAGEMVILHAPDALPSWLEPIAIDVMLPVLPWLAWLMLARSDERLLPTDRIWQNFRDRFGFVWSQRVREQFNHASTHAGWPISLGWSGLIETGGAITEEDRVRIEEVLRATMQRFL